MYPQVQQVPGCRLVDTEYVIIFERGGQDHALILNPAASRAFGLMDGRQTVDEIACKLAADCHGSPREFRSALRKLTTRLVDCGIVATRPKPWTDPCPVLLQRAPLLSNTRELPAVADCHALKVAAAPMNAAPCTFRIGVPTCGAS